ncbi:GH3 auxin-responsive promoter family protein [Bdellovibrio sp. HCB337]|uniref:GH3 family domain-containing protein n=1 Tax=Bdellovibrio sp. HCB337 TaxID=3394358 RepID=UPI0039A4C595
MKLARHLFYPVTIATSFAFFYLTATFLPSLPLRTFLSVALGASMIWWGESLLPFRKEWVGFDKQAKMDGTYLFLVHAFLGRVMEALTLSLVLVLQQKEILPAVGIWPAEWPAFVQVIALTMLSEFFRYWLHRSCHEFPLLWQIHAVHHSNLKMYWWNVGRFHPIEKIAQLCFESILFIFLGVHPAVMALYFIFYSVNGFFQHCNIDIKLGWLNRLISGPEQHRYHHSYEIHESNNNYGNKTSIYDQLFGTYYLPDLLGPKRYGLHNPKYPQTFLEQMRAPFIKDLDKKGQMKKLSQALIEFSIRKRGERLQKRYDKASQNLREIQEQVLLKILTQNRDTHFLKERTANPITNISDFQKAFPLAEYEVFREKFETQDETRQWGLITEKPIFYTQTSGSTNKPKLIPILKGTLKSYQETQALWLYHAYRMAPEFIQGKFLAFSGQKTEKVLTSGLEVGATTAHIYASLPKWLRSIYVVPYPVYALEDANLKYMTILRLVLSNPDVSFLVAANPSTLLKIEELANIHAEQLLKDLESGSFHLIEKIPADFRQDISDRMKENPTHTARLRETLQERGELWLKDLFPQVRLVGSWQGGSCLLAYEKIRKHFFSSVIFKEVGYVASEGRMGVPMAHSLGELPSLFDYFFEFQEVGADGDALAEVYTLDQLKVGKEYLVIITTTAGLYRYKMNDIVEVMGMHQQIPLIRFRRKGSGITSITGEKLYENQFLEAVSQINQERHLKLEMMLIAHEEKSYYIALCETDLSQKQIQEVANLLDLALRKNNMEYDAKRDSQRLGPCRIHAMKRGFFHHFTHQEITLKNIRESQWKLKALNTFNNFTKITPDWEKWIRHD